SRPAPPAVEAASCRTRRTRDRARSRRSARPGSISRSRTGPRSRRGFPDPAPRPPSFQVLHLLAYLLRLRFELERAAADLDVLGLARDGIGLAVDLLHEEVEALSDRLPVHPAQDRRRLDEMRVEAHELLRYVGPVREEGGFLRDAAGIELDRGGERLETLQ